MTFLVNQPILQPENMFFSVLALLCHKNEGKGVDILYLEREQCLPSSVVLVLDQCAAVMSYHPL